MNDAPYVSLSLDRSGPRVFIRAANAAEVKAALKDAADSGLYEAVAEAHAAFTTADPAKLLSNALDHAREFADFMKSNSNPAPRA